VVYIRTNRPAAGLHIGEAGTIVHAVQKSDPPAYLVEFVNAEGQTYAEEFFSADQLSRRPLAPARTA